MGCFSSKDKHIDEGATFTKSSLLNDAQKNATSQDRADGSTLLHPHEGDNGVPQKQKSEVMKAASAFDALDARSKAAPKLEHVHDVAVGERNLALLAAFEKKEADARAPPVLQNVTQTDVRSSKIFGKLQEYEAKDAKVRAEPKLEKPFSQKTPKYTQPQTRSFIAPV